MARTFVALWASADAARRLADLAAGVAARAGARPMPAADLHMTLAFIGNLPDEAVALLGRTLARALREAGTPLPGPDDAVVLDRLGSFRGANVAWLGALAPPAWLAPLAEAVRAALDAAGVAYDRKPFVPHLTIVRGARVPAAPIDPIVARGWRVALACSAGAGGATGGRYRIVDWLG